MGYTASIDENDDTIINITPEEDSNDLILNIGNCLMTIIDKIIESKKYNLNVHDNGYLTTIIYYYTEIVEENVEKFNNIQIDQIIFNILNTEREKLSLLNDITKEKIKKFNIKINIIPPSKSPEDPEAYKIKVGDIEDNKETENTKFNIAISQYSIIKLSLKLDLNLYISISDDNTKDYYKSNKEYTNDFIEIDYEYENEKLIKYYNIDYPLDEFITEAKTEEEDLINNNVYSISDKVKSVVYKNKENDDVMMNFYNMINNTEQIKLEIPNIENGTMKNFDLISNVKLDIKRKASINNISYTIYEDTSETIPADMEDIPKSSYKKIHLTEKVPINSKYSYATSKNQKLKNSINNSISNVKLKPKKLFFVKGKQIIKTKNIRGKIKIKGLTNIINDDEEFILNIENDESGEPEYDDTFVTKTNANIKVISETSEEIILKFEEKENQDNENETAYQIQINKLTVDSKSNVKLSFPKLLTKGDPDIGTVELLGESTISFENLKKTVKPVTLLIPYGKDISDVIVGSIPSTLEIIKENAPQTTDEQLKEMENKIDELTNKINNLNSKLNKALAVLILTNDKLF